MKTVKYLSALLFTLAVQTYAKGQTQVAHQAKIYQSESGDIYVNGNSDYSLYIADSQGNSAPIKIPKNNMPKPRPMTFKENGKHTISHKDIVEDIFQLYSDLDAPVVKLFLNKIAAAEDMAYLIFNPATDTLRLKATDNLSGIENIYYSLDGQSYIPYTSPIVLSGEVHKLMYYAVDNVGNSSIIKTSTIDARKSITNLILLDSSLNEIPMDDVLSRYHQIELKTSIPPSKKTKTYYRFDEGQNNLYTNKIKLDVSNGDHTLVYFTKDSYGNTEQPNKINFYLDRREPIVHVELDKNIFHITSKDVTNKAKQTPKTYISPRTKIRLISYDDKAGVKKVYYSLNPAKKEFLEYEAPFTISQLGKNSISYFAVDSLNNSGQHSVGINKNGVFFFDVDIKGPEIKASFKEPIYRTTDSLFVSNKTLLQVTANDMESGLKKITYQVDNGKEILYDSPFTVKESGEHTIKIYAYDNVLNTNESSISLKVDNTPPTIGHNFDAPSYTDKNKQVCYPSHATLFVYVSDNLGYSKISVKINNGTETPYTKPITGFLKNKDYTVFIRASDKLGNEQTTTLRFHIGN
jgi:hypothetical protein